MSTQTQNTPLHLRPVAYCVAGSCLPTGTITHRAIVARDRGVPRHQAEVFAVQDRASGLAASLALLIERSQDPALIAAAEKQIERWNQECNDFFRVA